MVCVGCDSSKVPSDVFISAPRRLNADKIKKHLARKDSAPLQTDYYTLNISSKLLSIFPSRVLTQDSFFGDFRLFYRFFGIPKI